MTELEIVVEKIKAGQSKGTYPKRMNPAEVAELWLRYSKLSKEKQSMFLYVNKYWQYTR